MIVRAAAAVVGLWALANMGPLGWFLLCLALVAIGLVALAVWPFLLAGVVGWAIVRGLVYLRARGSL